VKIGVVPKVRIRWQYSLRPRTGGSMRLCVRN